MKENLSTTNSDIPATIANRYVVHEELGRGGMAIVYRVTDTVNQKQMALKKLVKDTESRRQKHYCELFEQEYYTLAQLAHPRVVEVYDFGFAEQEPYYTMELLDGGDLRTHAPIPWQRACSLLIDICSVLGLLHSRRLVHRDITPRNVRCTADGNAKLIDFGAMVPMGVCKQVVGTPAHTAPEVVTMQPLDAQTDLYSLGTTLYYALTGKKAYPVRSFAELRSAWRNEKPRLPSTYVDVIPDELEKLVMSLIDLDPMVRPMNAAEVIERLSAIASLKVDENLLVSQAYLLKPILVGREKEIGRIRSKILRAIKDSGRALLLTGSPGTGRSRFLDACALEGQLVGATVVRIDANDAQSADWGAVRALISRLLDAIPEQAVSCAQPYLPVLGHVLPELLDRFKQRDPSFSANALRASETRENLRPQIHDALRNWLRRITKQRLLLIAVDDVHRIDEPSAAFFALLANHISDRKLVLVAALDSDAPSTSATRLLSASASRIKLRDLSADNTTKLLKSIFGEVPQVQLLSDRLYKMSKGNPNSIMQMVQHLLDKGIIHYQSGAWTLPYKLESSDIPSSLTEALKIKLTQLSEDARDLAQTLSLSPQQSFSFEECLKLIGTEDKALLVQVITELRSATIILTDGDNCSLSQSAWISILHELSDAHELTTKKVKLAGVLLHRGDQACRAAKLLFEAGEEERALDVLIDDSIANKKRIEGSSRAYSEFVISLPQDWAATYERAIEVCHRLGRPRKQRYLLQVMMARIGDQAGLNNIAPLRAAIEQLIHDSGLEIYHTLEESLPPEKRLQEALDRTQKRYDSLDESQRVLPPLEAVSDLARTLSNAMGIAAGSYEYSILEAMPSIEPLASLSPALRIISNSARSTQYAISTHLELCVKGLQETLLRISEPDRAGLDETIYKYVDLGHRWGMGINEANFGNPHALEWLADIEKHPFHQVNAWRIRLVHYLRLGDIQKAEECKKKLEMLQIQNSPKQFYEGVYQLSELIVYILAEDLIRVKRTIPGLEAMARRYGSWLPILQLARAEYQRIRGDNQAALFELEKVMSTIERGKHKAWPNLVGSYIKVLSELGRGKEAKKFGEENLRFADEIDLQFSSAYIRLPLAIIQASLGDSESAIDNCNIALNQFQNVNSSGITLGWFYETRAHVAISMNDEKTFETYIKLCAEKYRAGNYPALIVKYEKLLQKAYRCELRIPEELAKASETIDEVETTGLSTAVSSVLTDCQTSFERAQRALELLIVQSKSIGGYLYTLQKGGPTLSAQYGNLLSTSEIEPLVRDLLKSETMETADVTMTVASMFQSTKSRFDWPVQGKDRYIPVLLGHNTDKGYVITGLSVLCTKQVSNFAVPIETVTTLSRSLLDAGDVIAVLAA